MANLCETVYKVTGPDEELQELFNLLDSSIDSEPQGESGFGRDWLGEAILRMGFSLDDYPNHRGEITFVEYTPGDECVQIFQTTAWSEQPGFRHAIEARFPHCKVYYQDEEPGCERFTTNDTTGIWFYDKFILRAYMDDEWDDQYFETLEEAKEYLAENYALNFTETDDLDAVNDALDNYLIEKYAIKQTGSYFNLYEFEIVED